MKKLLGITPPIRAQTQRTSVPMPSYERRNDSTAVVSLIVFFSGCAPSFVTTRGISRRVGCFGERWSWLMRALRAGTIPYVIWR